MKERLTSALGLAVVLAATGCGGVGQGHEDGVGVGQGEETGSVQEALTTASFTASYSGHGWSGCTSSKSIKGYEPTDAGTYPVFVFLTGTSMTFDSTIDENLITYMASLGFVAATVQYDNGTYPTSCSDAQARASCIYNTSSSSSAISKLCSRSKADCVNKGIYVSGFSQGANLSSMAANYAAHAKAAYLLGNGDRAAGLVNLSACLDKSHITFTSSQLREVDGEKDQFFGSSQSGVQTQLTAVTGVTCAAGTYDCLGADGSGWAIVKSSDVTDGSADHCYFYNNGSSSCNGSGGMDTNWNTGSVDWERIQGLTWLASK